MRQAKNAAHWRLAASILQPKLKQNEGISGDGFSPDRKALTLNLEPFWSR
jgi:hypothetical protein